jgi:hypothetical protein
MYNGKGKLTLANGHIYTGEFKDNIFIVGHVVLTCENMDQYQG